MASQAYQADLAWGAHCADSSLEKVHLDSMEPRMYLTGLLCLTTLFLYADQNALAPNLSAVAKEFGFSDVEKDAKLGGEVALGFFLIGGVVSVLVGALADTVNRCKLFMYIVCLGEMACVGTYLVTTYEQLLFCRILTGISIGGCNPIVYSILGDCFPGSSRVYVTTVMGLAMSVGVAGGQLLAGLLGPTYGWRSPFIVIAVPAMVCGILVYVTATEPRRGGAKEALKELEASGGGAQLLLDEDSNARERGGDVEPDSNASHLELFQPNKIADLLRTPTVALCYLQGIPGCVPWSIITVFLSDYLSTDRGLTVKQATFVFVLFGIGGLCGQISGGWLGQALYNRDKRLQCLLMGVCTLTAVLPMLSILATDFAPLDGAVADENGKPSVFLPPLFLLTVAFTGFFAAFTGPNVRSVLQNVTSPENRGTAFALFTLSDDIGKGGGPAVVAFLVTSFGSRRPAFSVGILAWVVCGIALCTMSLFVNADEAYVAKQRAKRGNVSKNIA